MDFGIGLNSMMNSAMGNMMNGGMGGIPGMGNMMNGGMGGIPGMGNMMNGGMGGIPGMGGMNDLSQTTNLSNFTAGLGNSDSSQMLKGAISKIQTGQTVNPADLQGLSGDSTQLIQDLQGLVARPGGTQKITGIDGASSTKDVADKFSEMLNNYVNNVNQQNKDAEKAVETFASGGDIDVHSVMIASEKANLSMQLAMQLSNKILAAYREINNVRV